MLISHFRYRIYPTFEQDTRMVDWLESCRNVLISLTNSVTNTSLDAELGQFLNQGPLWVCFQRWELLGGKMHDLDKTVGRRNGLERSREARAVPKGSALEGCHTVLYSLNDCDTIGLPLAICDMSISSHSVKDAEVQARINEHGTVRYTRSIYE